MTRSAKVHPTTLPHGETAMRLGWVHLPPHVRRQVEQRLGTTVVDSFSKDAGFTPGLASVLLCADGTRHFIKAASMKAQRYAAASYKEEARKARTLPPGLPAPRLRWTLGGGAGDEWIVLGFEYVDGRQPARPWSPDDLAAASDLMIRIAEQLTPAPGLGIETFAEAFKDWPALWEKVAVDDADYDFAVELEGLAARFAEVTEGDTLVHADVRDDNLIVRPDGSMVLCDWNWPVRGAAWVDSLLLLIGPRGDGLDVEAHIAAHPLLSSVDPEAIDIVLALMTGYYLYSAAQPPVSNSPWLREVTRWQGEVCWNWLYTRRRD
ncbi:phosphotransferase family protein [Nocardioides sp. Kera G14]|uniref:phosphotransferase family protein n=1 Tax=Nocardioides sp. Kera G14 TaxID=2884264 RepID=UPI001D10B1DC|nr:phosphotransferase [Nocardioides sp. Kera G14]UDY24813.1 aminoglycoside phosphotransferase family protein [Nocardioides sp. Kera G14]